MLLADLHGTSTSTWNYRQIHGIFGNAGFSSTCTRKDLTVIQLHALFLGYKQNLTFINSYNMKTTSKEHCDRAKAAQKFTTVHIFRLQV